MKENVIQQVKQAVISHGTTAAESAFASLLGKASRSPSECGRLTIVIDLELYTGKPTIATKFKTAMVDKGDTEELSDTVIDPDQPELGLEDAK